MSVEDKPKIIIHVCCAVCGAALVELLKERLEPIVFFYNPNIYPQLEYERRKQSAETLASNNSLEFIEGTYENDIWLKQVKGLEKELEGGKRCDVCFAMRLQKAAELTKNSGAAYFTSTLFLSPYKNDFLINKIGEQIGKQFDLSFLTIQDLSISKKEFWQKTREVARKNNFYHQKYCGCVFSQRT